MMKMRTTTTTTGKIVVPEPGGLFRVELEDGQEITAHVAEEFRRISVAPRPGDKVVVKRSERDPARGSIVGASR